MSTQHLIEQARAMGRKDYLAGLPRNPAKHASLPGSLWAGWYREGYNAAKENITLPHPNETTFDLEVKLYDPRNGAYGYQGIIANAKTAEILAMVGTGSPPLAFTEVLDTIANAVSDSGATLHLNASERGVLLRALTVASDRLHDHPDGTQSAKDLAEQIDALHARVREAQP